MAVKEKTKKQDVSVQYKIKDTEPNLSQPTEYETVINPHNDLTFEKRCTAALMKVQLTKEIFRSRSPFLPWDFYEIDGITNLPVKQNKTVTKKVDAEIKLAASKFNNNKNSQKKYGNLSKIKKKTTNPSGFRYYSNYSDYCAEYRELRQTAIKNCQTCACHGAYTLKDVQKFYSEIKSSDRNQIKNIRQKPHVHRTTEDEDDQRSSISTPNDDVQTGEIDAAINLTPLRAIKHSSVADEIKDNEQDIGKLLDRHLGRNFFECNLKDHKPFLNKGARCPVVDIAIPEKHTITRIAQDGQKSGKSLTTKESSDSGFKLGIDDLDVSEWDQDEISYSGDGASVPSSFYSNAVSPITRTSLAPSAGSNIGRINASVRDLHPFSRNGIISRAKRKHHNNILKKMDNLSISGTSRTSGYSSCNDGVSNQTPEKQSAPWKALCYLGYKPSMRKYLNQIYTPIKRERSLSSASNARADECMVAGKPFPYPSDIAIKSSMQDKPKVGQEKSNFKSKNNCLKVSRSPLNEKHSNVKISNRHLQDPSVVHKIIEKRLIGNRHERSTLDDKDMSTMFNIKPRKAKPNLGILSKCQTVVRPPVGLKISF